MGLGVFVSKKHDFLEILFFFFKSQLTELQNQKHKIDF